MGLSAKLLQAKKLLLLLADLHRGIKDLPTIKDLDAFLSMYKLRIDYERCIRCFCCQELCPHRGAAD